MSAQALIDFTLSNARRFYSSMGNLLDGKGLMQPGNEVPGLMEATFGEAK